MENFRRSPAWEKMAAELIENDEKIEALEQQIEKMKCCTNCRYCIKEWGEFNPNSPNCKKCHNQSNWKLRR
jgi:hypothetical protein